ncbi:hypothetical protein AEP_03709 [Curvibacter sp. AEP1-3]|nr:hypothetical protein AEP_03709 [Curvibacter sp. AEP1-3]
MDDAPSSMTSDDLAFLTATDLEALPLSELKACWAAMRNACFDRDRERTRWGGSGRDERDGTYFHLCMKRAVAMLLLLGKHGWRDRPNAISDVRVPVLEYFERANTCALNGQEPRELLEYLLAFKKQYHAFEYDIDQLLLKIVDDYPHIGQHNFTDCPDWWAYFRRFAKGLRHRSRVFVRGESVEHYLLADSMKDLYYDELAELLHCLAQGVERDAEKDQARGRSQLASALLEAQQHLQQAQKSLQTAWKLCAPHVDMARKHGQLEHVFDEEEVKAARVGQFVYSYQLTLRMHREGSDIEVQRWSLLEGSNYHRELVKDPDFETKIYGLIAFFADFEGEDAAVLEQEINPLIERDVWTFQHRVPSNTFESKKV